MHPIAKGLIIVGSICVAAGFFWQFFGRHLPLGKLPGDIAVEKENFKFYFPLTTSIVLSILLSLVAWLFRKF